MSKVAPNPGCTRSPGRHESPLTPSADRHSHQRPSADNLVAVVIDPCSVSVKVFALCLTVPDCGTRVERDRAFYRESRQCLDDCWLPCSSGACCWL